MITSIQTALGEIVSEIHVRHADRARLEAEIATLEQAAQALRKLAPLPHESTAPARKPRGTSSHTVTRTHGQEPCLEPEPTPAAAGPPVPADLKGQYPEVRARRARVLDALPLKHDIRCGELARHLDLAQCHVQTDLEALLAQGFAVRTGWGRWRRATEEVVVFSGKDSLLSPPSMATSQPS